VDTERAYLWFAQALEQPNTETARVLAADAKATLEFLIERWGKSDPYPFHVLGSQGLSWARRGIPIAGERERFLRSLVNHVEAGCHAHPSVSDLKQLLNDLKKEYLQIAVHQQQPLQFHNPTID